MQADVANSAIVAELDFCRSAFAREGGVSVDPFFNR
jgi:hypothetical protein